MNANFASPAQHNLRNYARWTSASLVEKFHCLEPRRADPVVSAEREEISFVPSERIARSIGHLGPGFRHLDLPCRRRPGQRFCSRPRRSKMMKSGNRHQAWLTTKSGILDQSLWQAAFCCTCGVSDPAPSRRSSISEIRGGRARDSVRSSPLRAAACRKATSPFRMPKRWNSTRAGGRGRSNHRVQADGDPARPQPRLFAGRRSPGPRDRRRTRTCAYDFTAKGNLVAVISNGTAILGLGNLGALAASR
jgi:hypothetical protein